MPFYGRIGIPAPEGSDTTVSGSICKWSVREGEFVSPNKTIGTVEVGGKIYGLVVCFPALIRRLCAVENSAINADDVILEWAADGESIPYGRSYFRLESGSSGDIIPNY